MREFKNKTDDIYLDMKNYFIKEKDYLNSEELNEEDYLNFNNLKFEDYIINDDGLDDDLDDKYLTNSSKYIEDFIDKFLKVFPNIYTKNELRKILEENVMFVNEKKLLTNVDGYYSYYEKKINVRNLNNDVTLFHEFIHGLRGSEEIEEIDTLAGIIESLTSYAEKIYEVCSNFDFEKNYSTIKYCATSDKIKKIKRVKTYYPLLLIAQQIELLYKFINPKNSILISFLKRENIYSKIKEIYIEYYNLILNENNLSFKELEYKSMRSAYELIVNINDIHKLICNQESDCNLILLSIRKVESELKKLLNTLNVNNEFKYQKAFNNFSTTEYIESVEDKLMKKLFNKEADDIKILKNIFNDDYYDNPKTYKKIN